MVHICVYVSQKEGKRDVFPLLFSQTHYLAPSLTSENGQCPTHQQSGKVCLCFVEAQRPSQMTMRGLSTLNKVQRT